MDMHLMNQALMMKSLQGGAIGMAAGLSMLFSACQAERVQVAEDWRIDSIGIDWQYGKDSMMPEDWQCDHCTNEVDRYSIRVESDSVIPYVLNDSWKKWTVGTELHYSDHKADEKPDYGQDTGFKEIGFNAILKRHIFNRLLYIGFIAGLSYVDNFPEFENKDWNHCDRYSCTGRSHWLGSYGAVAGKDWPMYKAWSLRTELRATHTSDPFRSYSGINFIAAVVGVTYRFN
jgi:hypothetical protein